MSEFFVSSAYFGVVLSIGAFLVGRALQQRFKHPLCNPLLIAIVLVILFLLVFDVDYESYQSWRGSFRECCPVCAVCWYWPCCFIWTTPPM